MSTLYIVHVEHIEHIAGNNWDARVGLRELGEKKERKKGTRKRETKLNEMKCNLRFDVIYFHYFLFAFKHFGNSTQKQEALTRDLTETNHMVSHAKGNTCKLGTPVPLHGPQLRWGWGMRKLGPFSDTECTQMIRLVSVVNELRGHCHRQDTLFAFGGANKRAACSSLPTMDCKSHRRRCPFSAFPLLVRHLEVDCPKVVARCWGQLEDSSSFSFH